MNLAIWKKAVTDAWLFLSVCCVMLILFSWIFVWLMGLLGVGNWSSLLRMLPTFFHPMLGVPVADLAGPTGQISFLYVHVITLIVCVGWAVGRGSDVVAGEISRGTMDLILSLPVRRTTVIIVPSIITACGTAILAASVLLGTWLGLLTFAIGNDVSIWRFVPASINLFAMVFCLTAVTTFFSSYDRDRWRVIWIASGFFIVSTIVKMVAQLWKPGEWLGYTSFLMGYDPQKLILMPDGAWSLLLKYDATLIGMGLLVYAIAAIIFVRRDIPQAF